MSNFETAGAISKDTLDTTMKSFSAVTKGLQQVASETTEFTKSSYEHSAKMMEQLLQTRSLEKAIELQTDYAKSAYQAWVSQATKIGEIYSDMARESYKPFETVVSTVAAKSGEAFRKTV
jgi:phasin family protein